MRDVLELAGAGAAGTGKGARPVLRDGVVVATLRASNGKGAATAVVENSQWVLARTGREPTGRAAHDPEGTRLQVEPASRWRGTHRYLADGGVAAESGSTGGWWPRPTLRADGALSLDQQVFLLWLELVLRGRDSAVFGGGDGGGGGD